MRVSLINSKSSLQNDKAPSTRIRIFLNPQLFFQMWLPSTRIRRIRQWIRIFLNLLSRVEKKSATNPITCGQVNPDIFESNDVANSCPVLRNNKPIWRHNSNSRENLPPLSRAYGSCAEHVVLQSSPGYYSEYESGYHRMRVDRRIWFEYATCGRGDFWIRKEKVADSKYPDTCGRGLISIPNSYFYTCYMHR